MLVPHIQLRYKYEIRTYGALSTTVRKRFGWIAAKPSGAAANQDNPNATSLPDDGEPESTHPREFSREKCTMS